MKELSLVWKIKFIASCETAALAEASNRIEVFLFTLSRFGSSREDFRSPLPIRFKVALVREIKSAWDFKFDIVVGVTNASNLDEVIYNFKMITVNSDEGAESGMR